MSVEWVPLIGDFPCLFRTTCQHSPDVRWGDSGEYGQTVGVRTANPAVDGGTAGKRPQLWTDHAHGC